MNRWVPCLSFLAAMLLVVSPARTEVRVDEDEVVFSLSAPEASVVFLVGDFNNWNPTMEKMERAGDRFEVRLFLLPGSYRYKFVVDGTWMADPDNSPKDSVGGSKLRLEERAGTLVLGEDREPETIAAQRFIPSARYRGLGLVDDEGTTSDQTVDLYLDYEDERVRSSADFKTTDDSWEISPLRSEITFDRGYVDIVLGGARLRGFENDSIWASHDPFHLVGAVGVYDYSAGFGRKGFSFEMPLLLKTDLRLVYGDEVEGDPAGPSPLPAGVFGDFGASGSPDTLVYRFSETFSDADMWAMEWFVDMGSFKLGYVKRENRGFHPGLLVELQRRPGGFDLQAFDTRQKWSAQTVWLRFKPKERVSVGLAYADADAWIQKLARSVSSVSAIGEVALGADAADFDTTVPLQSSRRWDASVEYRRGTLRGTAEYRYDAFDFDPLGGEGSSADIETVRLGAAWDTGGWRTHIHGRYTRQNYGRSPPGFHALTTTRNFWRDDRDKLDVPGMVGFDLDRYMVLRVELTRDDFARPTRYGVPLAAHAAYRVELGAATRDFLAAVEYIEARVAVERRLWGEFYALGDARVAHYDKASWHLNETFGETYVELGWRKPRMELSLGLGFDPVRLDGVTSDDQDVGRLELLREAVIPGVTRTDATALGAGLRNREEHLEDLQSRLKLEVILFF